MSDLLAEMAESSRARCAAAEAARPYARVVEAARQQPDPPPLVLHDRFDLIAELKLRAPSVGTLAQLDEAGLVAQAQRYARAGAAAISVLTEPDRFDGDLSYLRAVAREVSVPVMRKDFLVSPYQVWEARLAGASGVLLIARMLSVETLAALFEATAEAGLFCLIELFGAEDLEKLGTLDLCRSGPPVLIGVNSRDLRSLQVVPDRLERLAVLLPSGLPAVAESGMRDASDVGAAASAGYRLALVGSALMATADPEGLASQMLAAGRSA